MLYEPCDMWCLHENEGGFTFNAIGDPSNSILSGDFSAISMVSSVQLAILPRWFRDGLGTGLYNGKVSHGERLLLFS